MCKIMSWVEHRGTIKFLTGETITSAKFLKWAKGRGISPDDYYGHSTTRAWYRIDADDGANKECTNFSTPDNFPAKIVTAIKEGLMRGLPMQKGLLCAPLYADYEAKRDALYADYKAKCAPLDADYEAKRDALYADYEAKCDALDADYEAKRAPLYADAWDLFLANEKNRSPKWR